MKNLAALLRGLLLLLAGIPLASSCSAELKTMARTSPQEEYRAYLQSNISTAKAIDLETLSAAVIVKALPYSPSVETRARLLFHSAPVFIQETRAWRRAPQGQSGTPLILLMGLFAPDLGEKDVTETGRFRVRLHLKTPEGVTLTPVEITRHGRDSVFMRDYFPAFDPWEEVFVLKFAANDRAEILQNLANCEFILEWPGGTEILPLKQYNTPEINNRTAN